MLRRRSSHSRMVFANIKSQILLRAQPRDLFIYSFRRCATNFFTGSKRKRFSFFLSLAHTYTHALGSDANEMIASVLFLNNVSPAVKQLKHHATPPAFIGITKKYVVRTIKVAALEPLQSVIRRARAQLLRARNVDFNLFHFGNSNEWRSLAAARATACFFVYFFPLARPPCAGGVNIFGCKLSQHLRRCDICPHHCIMHETRERERARCCAHLNAKATSSAEVFLNMSPAQYFSRLHLCPRRVQ